MTEKYQKTNRPDPNLLKENLSSFTMENLSEKKLIFGKNHKAKSIHTSHIWTKFMNELKAATRDEYREKK